MGQNLAPGPKMEARAPKKSTPGPKNGPRGPGGAYWPFVGCLWTRSHSGLACLKLRLPQEGWKQASSGNDGGKQRMEATGGQGRNR